MPGVQQDQIFPIYLGFPPFYIDKGVCQSLGSVQNSRGKHGLQIILFCDGRENVPPTSQANNGFLPLRRPYSLMCFRLAVVRFMGIGTRQPRSIIRTVLLLELSIMCTPTKSIKYIYGSDKLLWFAIGGG